MILEPLSRSLLHRLTASFVVIAAAVGWLVVGAATPVFSQGQGRTLRVSEAPAPAAPAESVHSRPPATEPSGAPSASNAAVEALATESGSQQATRDRPAQSAGRKLPADATTDHALALPGRTLRFKATAGSIPLYDGEGGKLEAEIAYIAFVSGETSLERPVTFVFNGGPGAASAYLNIGALGPWRLPIDRITASGPVGLLPNAETWLDFTDLVFVDPPGTGYSRLVGGDEVRRTIWSVDGDAEALAVFIRKWIEQNGRQSAPKFIVGESYGGIRALKVERLLGRRQGVGVRGMVLISPVLDFANLGQRLHTPMSYVASLPSMAATARELNGGYDRAALAGFEEYASGEYLTDLLRGERDRTAVKRMAARVSALTGLDPALVERLAGRIDVGTFQRELYRPRGLVGSAYDATVTAFDPDPAAAQSDFPDPVLDASRAPLASAMTELYRTVLNWRPDSPYRLLNGEVSSRWNWGNGRSPVQAVDDLRAALASDWRAHVLIAHGASDLVTPYFANRLVINQLPLYGSPERLKFLVYGGGHMFYSRDISRGDLRGDAKALYQSALTEPQSQRPAGE